MEGLALLAQAVEAAPGDAEAWRRLAGALRHTRLALFGLGRVTFLHGYPQGAGGRAFGVATTAIPTVGAYAWTLIEIARDLV
jgi:hypothetical protein